MLYRDLLQKAGELEYYMEFEHVEDVLIDKVVVLKDDYLEAFKAMRQANYVPNANAFGLGVANNIPEQLGFVWPYLYV